ncbi:MAG: 16S rRNA pseudouridine(516) synthase [Clostridia bacterium]|nr:16S rRNA pseudouridine(516) synthase [Clostridia bacterium]
MRLDRFLSEMGKATRRETALAVRRGEITVNGAPADRPDLRIDENADAVVFRGERIFYKKTVWLMLNKPQGVICATEDARGQRTVLDLLPPEERRRGLFPCGRLDADTTGLLLLTDDGETAHRLLSPKYHADKVYEYRAARPVGEEDCLRAEQGIELSDGTVCLPARIERLTPLTGRITLREGKYHQIKRMFGAMDNRILSLRRVSFAGIELPPDLPEGAWRPLTDGELERLTSAAGRGKMHKK